MEKMARQSDGTFIKKGPWTAEEDDILTSFVNKHGPRDWSSIRSKALLPRTGKSCRLRWVNKLRPNLKTGCKFTATEERIVIELQAQFGNKWAKISTYLPGRTDNDVKNFWSTRRKRMQRMLQNPSPKLQSNNNWKNHVHVNRDHHELAFVEVPESSSISVDSSSCNNYGSNNEDMKMVSFPDLGFPNLETNRPVLDPTPFQNYPFSIPAFEPQLDITLLPVDPVNDHFFGFGTELAPSLGGSVAEQGGMEHPATLDSFCFEDFPDDMFDHL